MFKETSLMQPMLHVLPIDLKRLNHVRKRKLETSNHGHFDIDCPVNNKPKYVQNNFLLSFDSKSPTVKSAPISAVRKLSQRNGKDMKENSNQLKREQSIQSNDTIRIIGEQSSTTTAAT